MRNEWPLVTDAKIPLLFGIQSKKPTIMEKVERFNMVYEYLRSRGLLHQKNDVALLMGVDKSNVSKAFNGNPKFLTDGFLRRFCKLFGHLINEEWLINEEGLMLKSTIHEMTDPDMFKHLTESDRKLVLGIISRIKQIGHYSDDVKNSTLIAKLISIISNNPQCSAMWIFTGHGNPLNNSSEEDFNKLSDKFIKLLEDYKDMKEQRDYWSKKSQGLEYELSKLKAV